MPTRKNTSPEGFTPDKDQDLQSPPKDENEVKTEESVPAKDSVSGDTKVKAPVVSESVLDGETPEHDHVCETGCSHASHQDLPLTHRGTVEERVKAKPIVVKSNRRNVQRFKG